MRAVIISIFTSVCLLLPFACGNELSQSEAVTLRLDERVVIHSEAQLKEFLAKLEASPEDEILLSSLWWYYTRRGEYRKLIDHTVSTYRDAEKSGNEVIRAFAGIYAAQGYLALSDYDSVKFYTDAVVSTIEERDLAHLTVIIHNITAIQAIQEELNFAKALDNLMVALDASRKASFHTNTGLLLCNIAYIYGLRQDPAGLPYAREAYGIGLELEDNEVLMQATTHLAHMYALLEEYDTALGYAQSLEQMALDPPAENHLRLAYVILAELADAQGNKSLADMYYNETAAGIDRVNDESVVLRFYMSYGKFLLAAGNARRAENLFSEGLELSLANKNMQLLYDFLLGLSRANLELGNKNEALDYYKMYHEHSDSMQMLRQEKAFNQLLMNYERLDHENEMKEQQLSLEKATRKAQTYIYLLLLLTLISASAYIVYRKRYLMYRHLVENHQRMVRMEQDIRSRQQEEDPDTESPAHDEADRLLYSKIEELMTGERLYTANDLSLEKIADILDSNRSYVSRVINKYSGMTFYNYINSHRIREAVKQLSDPSNDIPLKVLHQELGFNSLSAFYRSFQKETGVPPSKYREEVRRMERTKNEVIQ